MTLFETSGLLTDKNDKTNITHEFTVPDNIKALKITYNYSPKTVESRENEISIIKKYFDDYNETPDSPLESYLPVKNLITLSVDDSENYRGAAHRQDNFQSHIISKDFASPGFTAGEIQAGKWKIILNCHCVKCDVRYNLKAEGEKL